MDWSTDLKCHAIPFDTNQSIHSLPRYDAGLSTKPNRDEQNRLHIQIQFCMDQGFNKLLPMLIHRYMFSTISRKLGSPPITPTLLEMQLT